MKSVIASLVAVAGLTVGASAIVNTSVEMLVAGSDGVFGHELKLNMGGGLQKVEVLVRVNYVGTNSSTLGLASMNFQPTVSNWTGADVAGAYANGGFGSNVSVPLGVVADAPGQFGRISPFGRTNLTSSQAITNFVHSAGSGGAPAGTWLRIAQKQVTSWIGGAGNTTGGSGINIAQLANVGRTASDPAFNPSLSVNVFRFSISIQTGSDPTIDRADMAIDAPIAGFGNRVGAASTSFPNSLVGDREVYWWDAASLNASSGGERGTAIVVGGLITFSIPSPSSMALLGLGGLCVARRRR